jgi:O-antigen ligase
MIRKRLDHILTYGVIGAVLVMFLSTVFDFVGIGLSMLGRDATLTGRTDIWDLVLAEQLNPLVGAGFYSFWTGERIAKFWELYGVGMNQAHNGYLETYLIGGVIGVGLLLAMLVSAGRTIKKELVVRTNWGSLRLIFWLVSIVHNWTEASFSKLTLLWFLLLTVIMEYPRPPKTECANKATRGRRSAELREPVRNAC